MDIQLEKKKGFQKKHIPYVAGGAFFLILVGWIVFGDHASTLKVDARGVNIGNVTKEQFNDFVRVNGQVQPITVVQLRRRWYRAGKSSGRRGTGEERGCDYPSFQFKSRPADLGC